MKVQSNFLLSRENFLQKIKGMSYGYLSEEILFKVYSYNK